MKCPFLLQSNEIAFCEILLERRTAAWQCGAECLFWLGQPDGCPVFDMLVEDMPTGRRWPVRHTNRVRAAAHRSGRSRRSGSVLQEEPAALLI